MKASFKVVTDGWHRVYNYDVMIKEGVVLHATDKDCTRTLYPYRSTLWGYVKEEYLTLNALRSGLRRGTITLR